MGLRKSTDTRPADSYEFKLSDTIRLGENVGEHYTFYDIRPEIEYGVTDKLTVVAEAIIFIHGYDLGSEAEGAPCPMCEAGDGKAIPCGLTTSKTSHAVI